ncbi:hypothetical protein THIX_30134 [Thiomonas sp. X19]|uniref:hypothetical protein n=1 Tax=Thiomonas sp. X19 TaxID=1050370 RepID=UPI000B640CB8|nr:hypothetical protein [Thiomonas sp. X19]SCC92906.1 hypothetical protein THIX_30134 [Thiomonas sp. X19]
MYWHAQTKLLAEKRSDLVEQVFEGNLWLFTTGRRRKGIPEPAYLTHLATGLNLQDSGTRHSHAVARHLAGRNGAASQPVRRRPCPSAGSGAGRHAAACAQD